LLRCGKELPPHFFLDPAFPSLPPQALRRSYGLVNRSHFVFCSLHSHPVRGTDKLLVAKPPVYLTYLPFRFLGFFPLPPFGQAFEFQILEAFHPFVSVDLSSSFPPPQFFFEIRLLPAPFPPSGVFLSSPHSDEVIFLWTSRLSPSPATSLQTCFVARLNPAS